MTRTLISLDNDDKQWLAQRANREHVPMAEIVRRAIRNMRAEEASNEAIGKALLDTAGTWRNGDGLNWQIGLRQEWDGAA